MPITINGSFDVLTRQQGVSFVHWHPLELLIHTPISPHSKGAENVHQTMQESYEAIMSALPEKYQGYVENPDQ